MFCQSLLIPPDQCGTVTFILFIHYFKQRTIFFQLFENILCFIPASVIQDNEFRFAFCIVRRDYWIPLADYIGKILCLVVGGDDNI